jgi:hypothetical protein
MRRDGRLALSLAVAVAAAVLLGALLAGLTIGLAYLAPCLLIAAFCAAGWFPGERRLAAAIRRVGARRRAGVRSVGRELPARRLVPRGARLLAGRHAGRAPPEGGCIPAPSIP